MQEENQSARYEELADKWLKGTITPDEAAEYAAWYNRDQDRPVDIPVEFAASEQEQRDRILARALGSGLQPARVLPFRRQTIRVAAAAAVLLLLIGGYLYTSNRKPAASLAAGGQPIKNDVLPGTTGAILTLSNGQQVALDSTAKGAIPTQGQAAITNTRGQLAYRAPGERMTEIVYNTLSTGRGNQYQLLLADGTRVWLNSASTIKYPAAFTGTERAVAITGEAYFEVAKDRSKPFRVTVGGMTVQVLGTHFNVNGFGDEEAVRTTLLEGAVRIVNGNNSLLLQPGQQAALTGVGELTKAVDVDLDKVMAWKAGWFEFDQTSLDAILRQISRWYDVDIVYEGPLKADQFGGRVSKSLPLSDILHSLEANGNGVTFRLEGKKLFVRP